MMTTAPRVEIADVKAALTVTAALAHCGIEVTQPARGEWYGHRCPRGVDHRKSPRAFCVNPRSGRWICNGCYADDGITPLSGDLIRLIAQHERLTGREDFPKALAIAAEVAGVTGVSLSPEEREQRRRAQREGQERQRREEREQRRRHIATSIPKATAYWAKLARRDDIGEAYAAQRGVLEAVLRGLVRFDVHDHSSPALALRTSDGRIVNVIRRRRPEFAPTRNDVFRPIPGLSGGGTYVNALAEIGPGDTVVIPEGFFDSITATLAWPLARVLGARQSSMVGTVAKLAAPLVKRHGGRLLLVLHRDDAGWLATRAAIDAAIDAGLRLDDGSLEIVDHPGEDLNSSWTRGWRPAAGARSAA